MFPMQPNMPGARALTTRPNPPDFCDPTASRVENKPALKEERNIFNITQSFPFILRWETTPNQPLHIQWHLQTHTHTRHWTLQELILARNVAILSGGHTQGSEEFWHFSFTCEKLKKCGCVISITSDTEVAVPWRSSSESLPERSPSVRYLFNLTLTVRTSTSNPLTKQLKDN